jgi:hypothetical protein
MEPDVLLRIAAWSGAIIGATGAMKALGWLWRTSLLPGFHTLRRASNAIVKLAAIGDEESWPNGSTDLPTFLAGLHDLVKKILEFLGDDFRRWESGLRPDGQAERRRRM